MTTRDFGPGPHFLCIGAQKAGTTWLHRNLAWHPDVWLPPVKELHYFDGNLLIRETAPMEAHLRRTRSSEIWPSQVISEFVRRLFLVEPKDDHWYFSLFEFAKGRCCGDMTTDHALLDRATVARIHELLPSCRIFFVMRDPVERTWSQARMRLGRLGPGAVTLSLHDLKQQFDDPKSVSRGSYSRTIEIWESTYPSSQIRWLFYDRIVDGPMAFLEEVCAFLGLSFDPAVFAQTSRNVYHPSPAVPMPPPIRRYLSGQYKVEIETLAARFGGPTLNWLASCEAALKEA